MTDVNTNLSNVFGIAPIIKEKRKEITIRANNASSANTAEIDIDEVRSNTYQLLDDTKEAINELLELAKQSQDSDAFTALSSLIKTASTLNNDLLKLHETKRKLDGPEKTEIHNNLVLSSADLLRMLEEKKNG